MYIWSRWIGPNKEEDGPREEDPRGSPVEKDPFGPY